MSHNTVRAKPSEDSKIEKVDCDLSVIVVNYKVRDYLKKALRSILVATKDISSEIFVVDNGSEDGSVSMIRQYFPDVHVIENKENLGFSKANNQAIKKAKGKAIALVNPDVLVVEDTFEKCLDYLWSHNRVGAVGCKIIDSEGELQLHSRRSLPTPWVSFSKLFGLSDLFPQNKFFARYNLTYRDPDETTEVGSLSGSFMVVRKETIEDIGLLDERYFLYGEDLDWCYRMHQNGYTVVYFPKTHIIHYKGKSTERAPFNSKKYFYEAMRIFVKKHFQDGKYFILKWFLLLGIRIRQLKHALADLIY